MFMILEQDILRLIFGFKLRYYRNIAQFSLQQLSDKSDISVSYLNEIEKGKKYPTPAKIASLARSLQIEYDDLVSKNGNKKIQPILDIFTSDTFKSFPIADFGLDPLKLFELLSFSPDKVTAFISTILKIAQNYHLTQENVYISALRSFQDLHENYFYTLERKAQEARKSHFADAKHFLSLEDFKEKLHQNWNIKVDEQAFMKQEELQKVRSYYSKKKNILYINSKLSLAQKKFLLAREFAFQYLQLEERPFFTSTLEYNNFELLLNNFRASYFAAALIMDQDIFSKDLKQWMESKNWNPKQLSVWMKDYGVSAETLLQRMTNLLSGIFGLNDLFFIRLNSKDAINFRISKEIHLSRLHQPHASIDDASHCQRWISIRSIKAVAKNESLDFMAQISAYHQTENSYLCLSAAQHDDFISPGFSSVTIGLLVNEKLKKNISWLYDKSIQTITVNNTCRSCELSSCNERKFDYEPPRTENRLSILKKLVRNM